MPHYLRHTLFRLDIEAPQPFDKLPRNLADRDVAPPAVSIDESVEQGRGSGCQRDFEVQGKGMIGDSEQEIIRTSQEH